MQAGDYAFPCFRWRRPKGTPVAQSWSQSWAPMPRLRPYVNFFIDYGQLAKNIWPILTGAAFK